jgi:hypothetical protein
MKNMVAAFYIGRRCNQSKAQSNYINDSVFEKNSRGKK